MNDKNPPTYIKDLVTGNTEKYEAALLALIVVGVMLSTLDQKIFKLVSLIVLSLIAMVYLMTAFKDTIKMGLKDKELVFVKTSGFGSSIALIGIIFTTQGYPNNVHMLVVGTASLAVTLIFIFIKNKMSSFGAWAVIRMAMLGLGAVGFLLKGG